MRIIFVRHAESANNPLLNLPREEYLKVRKSDPDLTELGVKQVQRSSLHFRNNCKVSLRWEILVEQKALEDPKR